MASRVKRIPWRQNLKCQPIKTLFGALHIIVRQPWTDMTLKITDRKAPEKKAYK
jgi:hypothetical protein